MDTRAASVRGSYTQPLIRRWFEALLPIYAVAVVMVWFHPEYTPHILTVSVSQSPMAGIAWAVVGALGGLLGLWSLIVCFFLLYSPIYLIGKAHFLVGRGGWVDRREVRFYLICFGFFCAL